MKIFLTLAAAALLAAPALAQTSTSGSVHNTAGTAKPKCPASDPLVWLDTTTTRVYYMRGATYFGRTRRGRYVCLSQATSVGAHRAGTTSSHMMRHNTMSGGSMTGAKHHAGTMMSPRPIMSPMSNGSMGSGTAPPMSSPMPMTSGRPEPATSPMPAPSASGAVPSPAASPYGSVPPKHA